MEIKIRYVLFEHLQALKTPCIAKFESSLSRPIHANITLYVPDFANFANFRFISVFIST